MHCVCEREALLRALTICEDLCRAFPDLVQVTFSAHEACATSIEICMWHETTGVGVWATVPADVREAGNLTVPARTAAGVLATLPGSLVSLASVQLPAAVPDTMNDAITALPAALALQIEGANSAGRKQRTRLRLSPPLTEKTMGGVFAEWRVNGIPLASQEPRVLRKAWDPCLLLAKKHDEAADDTPDMNHALVLLHFDADACISTGTTRSAVAQTYMPWTRRAANVPASHVLIDERILRWISTALKQEAWPVTLTLVPQSDATALLLVTLSLVTLVCRVTTASIPLVWERRVHAPGSQVWLVSRVLLARALNFLAADRARSADRCLLLQVEDRQLCLQWDSSAQDDHAVCRVPIVNAVQESAPLLLHLRLLREMLRQFKGPVVCIEQGTLRVGKRADPVRAPVFTPFVRLSQPMEKTILMMMTTIPAGLASAPSATETKGEALAPV